MMVNCNRARMVKRSHLLIDRTMVYFQVHRPANGLMWDCEVTRSQGLIHRSGSTNQWEKEDRRRKFQRKIMKVLFGACKILTRRCLVNSQYMRYGEIKRFIPVKILHYAAVNWWLPNLHGPQWAHFYFALRLHGHLGAGEVPLQVALFLRPRLTEQIC